MRFSRAFTVIELLVVISVIALLVGILLPVLGAARESGRASVCLSGLRQMLIAASAYATEEDGALPLAYDYDDPTRPLEWDYEKDFGLSQIKPGLLWRGQSDSRVQQCPSFDGSATSPLDPYTGYNYNTSYLGGFRNGPGVDPVPSARIESAVDPVTTAVFGDGQWSGGANKFMRAPLAMLGQPGAPHDTGFSGRWAGTQGFRHHGDTTTQAGWLDGHASAQERAFDAGSVSVADGTGFLADDNSVYDLE